MFYPHVTPDPNIQMMLYYIGYKIFILGTWDLGDGIVLSELVPILEVCFIT